MRKSSQNNETESLLKKNENLNWKRKLLRWPYSLITVFGVFLLGAIFYLFYTFINVQPKFTEDNTPQLGNRSFYVDYEKNEFMKDGKAFRYVSGSMHYFRVPRPYWTDRIRKMKAAGLNTISSYIEWSLHEPYSGVYNFNGQADIEHFLTIAKQENMNVLIRPGPYISAERDLGGFPSWILKEKPRIKLRTSDPNYLKYVDRWFSVIMPKIVPHLYGNGGNIIMVQVENEYGFSKLGYCDKKYTSWLRDLIHHYVNDKALLYTTDQCFVTQLSCGKIPNVFSTVDFTAYDNATKCFDILRKVQKRGPLVNSEFYTGWVSYWDEPRIIVKTQSMVPTLKYFIAQNVSFNFYLFHGGTNFGFTSGAGANGTSFERMNYHPVMTSYDFTSPLNEAGDPTEKYYAIKHILKEANFSTSSTPMRAPKGIYGTVKMSPVVNLLENVCRRLQPVVNDVPLCFEDMDLNHGLVLYETYLPQIEGSTKLPLAVDVLNDRATVFINNVKIGIMSRTTGNTTMELPVSDGKQRLSILVENQGRISERKFLSDRKGILSDVTLGTHILGPWTMTGYPLNDTSWLESQNVQPDVKPPAYYRGSFVIPQNKPMDTFLDPSGWSKGVAFINGINIGRYWPAVGPQITLYVPAPYLVSGLNTIIMVELESAPKDFTVKFVDKHRLDW